MDRSNTFIPLEIQCFWCNGQMHRGTVHSGTLNCVTYFCERCGGVAHFAVNDKQKISSIEVEYKSPDKELKQEFNIMENNHVHLCNSCFKSYPDCSDDEHAIEFGDGIGGDNICCCNKYEPLLERDYERGGYK